MQCGEAYQCHCLVGGTLFWWMNVEGKELIVASVVVGRDIFFACVHGRLP
jgi:hypothetical protein